jgi:hypothetical protein
MLSRARVIENYSILNEKSKSNENWKRNRYKSLTKIVKNDSFTKHGSSWLSFLIHCIKYLQTFLLIIIKLQFAAKQMYISRLFKKQIDMYHRIINIETLLIFRFIILNIVHSRKIDPLNQKAQIISLIMSATNFKSHGTES